ncbi:MAG TPA: hypothetical protein VLM43_01215, partial [Desulfobacterales bacterium]|nr:hypothetical protein [Desulfobacterales bacterium]
AQFLLKSDPRWTEEAILDLLKSSARKAISLNEHVPVHLAYITAWVDNNGTVHFIKDVYKQDRRLANALKKRPYQFCKLTIDDGTYYSDDLLVF